MKYTQIPFCADVKQLHLPFIHIGIDKERSVTMLVDTGSENNRIFDYLYNQESELFTKTGEEVNLQGVAGSKISYFVSGSLYVKGEECPTTFSIIEGEAGMALSETVGFPVAGLIGTEFMLEHGWIVDFSRQAILIPEE